MREVLEALDTTLEALAMLRAFVERKGSKEHLRQLGDELTTYVAEVLDESGVKLV